ncbi:MAG: hypothetical protein ACR2RL_26690 [Gammaproteobacteria bacterium]
MSARAHSVIRGARLLDGDRHAGEVGDLQMSGDTLLEAGPPGLAAPEEAAGIDASGLLIIADLSRIQYLTLDHPAHQLVYQENGSDVRHVMVGEGFVLRDGRVPGGDPDELRTMVDSAVERFRPEHSRVAPVVDRRPAAPAH